MNEKNQSDVGRAMNHILRPTLAAFVGQKLSKYFGADWWQCGVLDKLYDHQKRFLPNAGTFADLTDRLDVQLCLLLIDIHWNEIFSKGLPRSFFNYFKELQTIRNLWAHEQDSFDDVGMTRALDTMILIADKLDEETAAKLKKMSEVKLSEKYPIKTEELIVEQDKFSSLPTELPAWRKVIEPHSDVAQGRYSQTEWAVNLAEAVRGTGRPEYTDAVNFFSRTYLTDGLKGLLVEILRRVSNGNGEPIIQLKTSFGGGKTHSLLALYHLFGGKIRPEQSSAVREVLKVAGVEFLPKVQTAVFVGTWENPLKSTLWGEIAARLAEATGKPELYEMMRENDEQKISPGAELLKEIFNAAGSCLVLIDELVAYGRKLKSGKITDGGTFGNLMSFIQELTEAAKLSPRTAVVVSIPESDAEIGGLLGKKVLRQVEKYFGRMEFVWTPVSVREGYEIVRRRLFRPCHDDDAREKVCSAFFNMYCNNAEDFPYDSRQPAYREKLMSCYPIHPKLFDFLYDKWTNLDGFQKTRGVLRLMAKVICKLWGDKHDMSALIMPSNIPLDDAAVQNELTKLLGGNWDAIVNSEVDGERSKPRELDKQNSRFGRLMSARKISRSIFMGTAPGNRSGDVRGVGENELHLCTIQPQEFEDIAVFNDALTKLKANLYYLYSKDSRLWFGVEPTLRKMVDDKRDKFSDDEIEYEIEQRLKKWSGRGQFKAIHVCPQSSAEVPDEQKARLVILSPKYAFDDRQKNNAAMETAKKILNERGNLPRRWKNMLLFLAAEAEKLAVLKGVVREFKAWSEVLIEARNLGLNLVQIDDAKSNLETATNNFAQKISQAYSQLLAPDTYESADLNLPPRVETIYCTTEDNISAASAKFENDAMLLNALGAENLKNLLDKFIWREGNSVNVNRLWEYFAQYYYMPRLVDEKVLFEAIRRAVKDEVVALADDENFSNLQFGEVNASVSDEKFLVKASKAQEIISAEKKDEFDTEPVEPEKVDSSEDTAPTAPEEERLPTKFLMDMQLDNDRYVKQFNKCVSETAEYLMNLPNAKMVIRFCVTVSVPEGIPTETKEIVEANCHDLKIRHFYFEK